MELPNRVNCSMFWKSRLRDDEWRMYMYVG